MDYDPNKELIPSLSPIINLVGILSYFGGTGQCPMNAEKVRDLMRQLAGGVGQPRVALRCDCENLETAYVAVDGRGTVRVTDDCRTFQYLDERTDSTYVPFQSLDLAAAAQVCRELRVELRSASPNG
jgi:hypothetical protein